MPISEKQFQNGVVTNPPLLSSAAATFAKRSLRRCKVCVHQRCAEFEAGYFERRLTQVEIAKIVGCSEEQVSEHMREHVKNAVRSHVASQYTEELAKEVVDKIGLLKKHLMALDQRATEAMELPVGPGYEQAVRATLEELRQYIRDLALLEGELKEAPYVKFQQINVQFNSLKQIVLQQLCPACKQLVLNSLEGLEKT